MKTLFGLEVAIEILFEALLELISSTRGINKNTNVKIKKFH